MTEIVTYKFYQEPGHNLIAVPADRWGWVALYSDGTFLEQYGSDGWYHQFKEIQQDKLAGFQMVNFEKGLPPITFHWKSNQKLIHFMRHTRYNVGAPNEVFVSLICFGYETPSDKVMLVLMPDDSVRIVKDVAEIEIKT
jgi:hypothetical protein